MMTPEQIRKQGICKWELLDLCQEIDRSVIRLDYKADKSGEETVTIVYNTSCGEYKRPVNVTGDSLSALARDILHYF